MHVETGSILVLAVYRTSSDLLLSNLWQAVREMTFHSIIYWNTQKSI